MRRESQSDGRRRRGEDRKREREKGGKWKQKSKDRKRETEGHWEAGKRKGGGERRQQHLCARAELPLNASVQLHHRDTEQTPTDLDCKINIVSKDRPIKKGPDRRSKGFSDFPNF